jgi:hypothetical protein
MCPGVRTPHTPCFDKVRNAGCQQTHGTRTRFPSVGDQRQIPDIRLQSTSGVRPLSTRDLHLDNPRDARFLLRISLAKRYKRQVVSWNQEKGLLQFVMLCHTRKKP